MEGSLKENFKYKGSNRTGAGKKGGLRKSKEREGLGGGAELR